MFQDLKLFTPYIWRHIENPAHIRGALAVYQSTGNMKADFEKFLDFGLGTRDAIIHCNEDVFMFLEHPVKMSTIVDAASNLMAAKIIGVSREFIGWALFHGHGIAFEEVTNDVE